MKREIGWKPLPTAIKVIWVIMIIGVALSLFSTISVYFTGVSILGFFVSGLFAVLVSLIFLAAAILLIIAIFKRKTWAANFGMGYFLFFTLNGLLGMIGLRARLGDIDPELLVMVPSAPQILYISSVVGILIGSIVNLLFFYLVYRNRSYFEKL